MEPNSYVHVEQCPDTHTAASAKPLYAPTNCSS